MDQHASPNKRGDSMNVFSQAEYYPMPSESKISYSRRNNNNLIIRTDLHALIVKLTSPVDSIDYPFLSDFFLSYRKFIAPEGLLKLLESRLKWAFNECMCTDGDRQKIGKVASVRTFVLLRHWLLNYFAQDFLANAPLRRQFVRAVNALRWDESLNTPKLIHGIVVNIKKSWVFCLKLMWEDVAESHCPQSAEEWLDFKIQNIESETFAGNNGKRLSLYALQSSQNPEFRNRSVLSLYTGQDKFQLPESNTNMNAKVGFKTKDRTASMFLFPQDNLLSAKVRASGEDGNQKPGNTGLVVPNSTSVSNVIKDLHVPPTPSVDKVIPPTPAKDVEFILRSSFLPSQGPKKDNITAKHSNPAPGMMGLLSKWRRNHNIRSANLKLKEQSPSLEIENFIKLVFSITSLENREEEQSKPVVSDSAKFDILSARTIDEVEFFITVENELLSKVCKHDGGPPFQEQVPFSRSPSSVEGVSVMDNLNLYKTVSHIASSVVSLSKTSQQHQLTSPSFAARERRLVNSTDCFFRNDKSAPRVLGGPLRSNTKSPVDIEDRPRKLVFHETRRDGPMIRNEPSSQIGTDNRNITGLGISDAQMVPNFSSERRISPSRPMRISSSIAEVDDTFSQQNQFPTLDNSNHEIAAIDDFPIVKRKEGVQNLREFNFEESTESGIERKEIFSSPIEPQSGEDAIQASNGPHDLGDGSDLDEDTSSFFTSNDEISIREESKHFTPASSMGQRSVTNSSGRISIMGHSNRSHGRSPSTDQHNFTVKCDAYSKLENVLLLNEEKVRNLQVETGRLATASEEQNELRESTSSLVSSVPTEKLFLPKDSSPRTTLAKDNQVGEPLTFESKVIRLSSVPSIRSIVSGESITSLQSAGTFDKQDGKVSRTSGCLDFVQINNSSLSAPDGAGPDTNKYLFSPDSESVDYASPEKNVNNLRNKFIGFRGSQTQSDGELKTNEADEQFEEQHLDELYQEKHENEHHRRTVTPIVSPYKGEDSRMNKFAAITDESLHGDPINVALMKLEGTFHRQQPKAEEENVQIEELCRRRLSDLTTKQRNSFLITRRRQVKSELPAHSNVVTVDADSRATEVKVTELLQKYRLQDNRLLVSNADQHIPFILMYDSKSIAEQLTLIEREILKEIDWKDLLDLKMSRKSPTVTSWLQLLLKNVELSGIDLAIARFNLTVDWIVSEIVLTTDNRLRRNTIQRFIHVADHCKKYQNYNTLMQIVLALSSLVVQSFRDAWRLIKPGDVLIWESLKKIPSLEKNYHHIRMLLNDIDPIKGCVPFIVVYLSDLTLNSEKNNWISQDQVLNYSKFQTNVQIVKNFIQRAQWSKFYDFKIEEELLSKCVYISCLSQDEIAHVTQNLL
ncbi:LADA_0F07338g1_1 [Lachancea dasiensis]|uniref:Guanine nucleotide exchange factor LTE1 n=1 Tax=Lachancea dasiensis TaxID=1072105 RepID=A0A1G4JK90_9SACH|nr:LADA_0F07338g1_1 [Lachancea dasiensis]